MSTAFPQRSHSDFKTFPKRVYNCLYRYFENNKKKNLGCVDIQNNWSSQSLRKF